jgi:hypoxia up-regulated 1
MIAKARAFIEKAKPEVESWPEKKPWLNETHVANLLEEIKQFESWLDEKIEAQDKLAATEAPTLESTEIKISQRPIETKFGKLKKKSKPKPPKVEKNETEANETDANETIANATDADAPTDEPPAEDVAGGTDADQSAEEEQVQRETEDEQTPDQTPPKDEL